MATKPTKQKILDTWKYIATHSDGKLSKGMIELVVETIRLLEETAD